ncbi:MAG: 4-hydroxy-3-methylbut-2-enyl diphosphate reductase [Bacteroidales bacterium]
MQITIEEHSGFCFGVVSAIEKAENELKSRDILYCLGDIVHNSAEVERLDRLGLKVIDLNQFKKLKNAAVLIRAHGEPPSTYQIAKANHIQLKEATCLIVLKLQKLVKQGFEEMQTQNGQVLIYGKEGHAEVVGLNGQTGNRALVVSNFEDVKKIQFNCPTLLFSQTTMNVEAYAKIKAYIAQKCALSNVYFHATDSICSRMAHRAEQLKLFVQHQDVVIFVSGEKSSNGQYLYSICQENNPNCHFISNVEDIETNFIYFPNQKQKVNKIGICGATSTPLWLMQAVSEQLSLLNDSIECI